MLIEPKTNTRLNQWTRGNTHIQGIRYTKTFFFVDKFNSIKLLLLLITQYDLEVYQLDKKKFYIKIKMKKILYYFIRKNTIKIILI